MVDAVFLVWGMDLELLIQCWEDVGGCGPCQNCWPCWEGYRAGDWLFPLFFFDRSVVDYVWFSKERSWSKVGWFWDLVLWILISLVSLIWAEFLWMWVVFSWLIVVFVAWGLCLILKSVFAIFGYGILILCLCWRVEDPWATVYLCLDELVCGDYQNHILTCAIDFCCLWCSYHFHKFIINKISFLTTLSYFGFGLVLYICNWDHIQ